MVPGHVPCPGTMHVPAWYPITNYLLVIWNCTPVRRSSDLGTSDLGPRTSVTCPRTLGPRSSVLGHIDPASDLGLRPRSYIYNMIEAEA